MAKHYIGQCITAKLSSEHIAKVKIPSTGLKAGQCVIADTLDASILGNLDTFVATQPTTENLASGNLAIVLNGGFETLSDGRRPEGQPDYTQYNYKDGDEPATVVFVDEHLTFEISLDVVDGATTSNPKQDVGKYLIPKNASNSLTLSETANVGGKSLKIVAIRDFPVGGLYGNDFVKTYVCVATK